MAVTNQPPYPSGNSPNAPNYVETARGVVIVDGVTGKLASFGASGSQNVNVAFADTPSVDAFGRLRVSQPINRFDAQLTYDLQPLLYEQLTNGSGATINHDSTERCASLAFSNTPNGGYAFMQSYEWFYYQPGNSHLAEVTFNFIEQVANVTKFVGYGDRQNNGIHFFIDGTNVGWRVLSNTSVGNEVVYQDDWNMDPLDGTGDSGVTLDITKTQIAVIDLQALYVGRIRVGFNIDGVTIFCHEFLHANRVDNPYIQIASLPIIGGMEANATVTATMQFICTTVRSEGGDIDVGGFNFSAEDSAVAVSSGARTHIMSIRPLTTFNSIENRSKFILESIDILNSGNNPIVWELVLGQAITGASWADVNSTYSAFEQASGTISGSPAIVATSGHIASTNQTKTSVTKNLNNRYPITLNAAGTIRALGTLSLLATGIGGASTISLSINYREVR